MAEDSSMMQPWNCKTEPVCPQSLFFLPLQRILHFKNSTCRAPVLYPNFTTYLLWHQPLNIALATKSAIPASPNGSPQTKKWNCNVATCCTCHEKWHSNIANGALAKKSDIATWHLPRKVTLNISMAHPNITKWRPRKVGCEWCVMCDVRCEWCVATLSSELLYFELHNILSYSTLSCCALHCSTLSYSALIYLALRNWELWQPNFNWFHILSFSGLTPRLQHRREVWCWRHLLALAFESAILRDVAWASNASTTSWRRSCLDSTWT